MKDIALSHDLLNSSKILFHYGKMLEDICKGKEDFTPVAIEVHPTAVCNHDQGPLNQQIHSSF